MLEPDVDRALKDWAYWVTCGCMGDGYPTCNVLHKSWLPPTPGSTPTLRASRGDPGRVHRRTHRAIGTLSIKLSNTVVVHYCYRLSVAEQCARLGCAPSTLHARLQVARSLIAATL